MKSPALLALAAVAAVPSLRAQTLAAPFNTLYTLANVGAVPGLPATTHGGIVFDRQNPNKMLCTTWATTGVQNCYSIDVVRDAQGHVTGFSGTATPVMQLDRIDAGLAYHPSGVLFYARYPVVSTNGNSVGQLKPGSTVPDRVDTILGPNWLGGLDIVPDGLPGAGQLKTVRWSGGEWTSAQLTPDANGTFDIVGETQTAVLTGGPDGFCYLPRTAPLFNGGDVLVAEFNLNNLVSYTIDGNGDPIPATRQVVVSAMSSAFAVTVDPVTQDVVHSAWSGGSVHVIRGFGLACGPCNNYGTGLAGTGGLVPHTTWFGCALAGETTGVHVGNGLPNGLGILAAGFTQQAIPVFGGTLLNEASVLLTLFASPAGNSSLPLPVPIGVSGLALYFQAAFLDPGAVQGFALSDGLAITIP